MANHSGKPGGAVLPLASAQALRAFETGIAFPVSSVRPVQLVRRQRHRGPQRQVSVAWVNRFSRLCVLMNPCPAGRAVHSDLAGEIPEKTFSCGPGFPGGHKR